MATEAWSETAIPQIYNQRMTEQAEQIMAQFTRANLPPPVMHTQTAADIDAVSILRRNLNADLTNAIDHVGRMLNDEIRQAGLRAGINKVVGGQTAKQMQAELLQMLQDKGIAAIEYMRAGKPCYMSLSAYADLVARSTVHEARNVAAINLGKRIGNTLVKISSHYGACPICTPYQGRVFSTSRKNTDYPYLYDTPLDRDYQNFHPRCRHTVSQYIEKLQSPEEVRKMREYSNRGFEVGGEGWTKEQTEKANKSLASCREGQAKNRQLYTDRKQYQKYRAVLGNDVPKTFAGFRRMKNSDSWQDLKSEYRRVNRENGIIEAAKTPKGRHNGFYVQAEKWSDRSVARSAKSYAAQVSEHMEKINNPASNDKDWNKKTLKQQEGLINKWRKDLARNDELRIVMENILKKRGIKL